MLNRQGLWGSKRRGPPGTARSVPKARPPDRERPLNVQFGRMVWASGRSTIGRWHCRARLGCACGYSGAKAMDIDLTQYVPILLFVAIGLVLGLGFMGAAFVLAPSKPDPEKLSAYECGFNAFDDARMKFDVRFYLVAILFIIFDLEVAFLIPWAVTLGELGPMMWFGFWSMMVFLGVLTVGFIYEWKKGALEWE
jgi:NADH-quinone oxidoreductase subunit A